MHPSGDPETLPESLGRFLPRSFLGRGSFGAVYRVVDPLRPGSDLALKVLSPPPLKGRGPRDTRERILREFRLGALVRHPVVLAPIETGVLRDGDGSPGAPYLLMEFIDGRPLAPPRDAARLCGVAEDLLSALDAIHAAGWRHGDIQPRNILFRRSGGGDGARDEVRLLDFGLAAEIAPLADRPPTAGTPLYLAPEALRGERLDLRADFYSLGVVLYECLRGPIRVPLGDHLLRTRNGSFFREAAGERIEEPMKRLLLRLLDPQPASRLAVGAEGIDILRGARAAGGEPRERTIASFEAPRPIGRETFLLALDEGLGRLSRRRPSILVVEGGRGMGKTRLLREAIAAAFGGGRRAFSWPEAKALAGRGIDERGGPADPGPPGIGASDGGPASGASEAGARRGEAVLASISKEPSLLAIDDLDRLDAIDQSAVRFLAERLRGAAAPGARARRGDWPPLIVLSISSAAPGAPIARLREVISQIPWASLHTLGPWSREEASSFLGQVLPPRRRLGGLEEVILRQGGGNPERLRRILRELARGGELRFEGDAWISERTPLRGPVELPGERDAFLDGWRALGPLERAVLGIAALRASGEVSTGTDLLAAILAVEVGAIERAVREIDAREVIPLAEEGGSRAAAAVPRLDRRRRAWVLRETGPGERSRLRSLLGVAAVPRAEALEHALRSRPVLPAEVLAAARSGGAAAERLLAFHALRGAGAGEDRGRSALLLGRLLLARDDRPRARRFFLLARGLLRDPRERAEAEVSLVEIELGMGDLAGAGRAIEAAEALAPPGGEARSRLLFARGVRAFHLRRFEEAGSLAAEGARLFPDRPAFQRLRGSAALALGDLDGAGDALRLALQAAEAKGDRRESGSARTNLGRLHIERGSLPEAARLHREAARDFSLAGLPLQEALALSNLGATLRRAGDYPGALEAAGRSLALRREVGDEGGTSLAEANLGILARELGLPGTAARRFEAAEAAARAGGPGAEGILRTSLTLLENRALLALDRGDVGGALELLEARGKLPGRRGATSPEGLLIEARLLGVGKRREEDLEKAVEGRSFQEADAPALAELARTRRDRSASASPGEGDLAGRARVELRRLATSSSSPRAMFHHHLVELCRLIPEASSPERERLRAVVETFPARDGRREALAALVRTSGDRAERERLQGLLRRLLDEVVFDLDPEDRDAFRARPEIKEAIDMATPTETDGAAARRAADVLREVFRFNREILSETRPEELVRRILDAAIALTGAERGALALRREGGMRIVTARSGGKEIAEPEGQVSHTILERTLAEGTPRLTTDAREDATLKSIASVEELGLRSVICVPLRGKRRVLGALYLDNPFEKGVFDSSHLELAESFSSQAALAWMAAENRRKMTEVLAELREANSHLGEEVELLRRDSEAMKRRGKKEFCGIAGDSAAMREVFHLIEVVAPTEIPVLITGETGTGKELVARAIHRLSRRSAQPFIAENCAAVPPTLLESALFGHARGAFTGADSDRKGLFEMASGGTLFLDEIGDLPADLQTRLLRVLQEREVRPLGSSRVVRVDVRVLAATNRPVAEAMAQGKFRQDLYYRLQGAEIRLPPLRGRQDDIPLIVERILAGLGEEGQPPRKLAAETMEKLSRFAWPGNVRELENEVRRLALLAPPGPIGPELLSPAVREGIAPALPGGPPPADDEVRPLVEVERAAIRRALEKLEGHRGKVAEALGISRSTLYLKLKEMGLAER